MESPAPYLLDACPWFGHGKKWRFCVVGRFYKSNLHLWLKSRMAGNRGNYRPLSFHRFLNGTPLYNATIAIMTPVALMVAFQFGLEAEDARAFVLTCCIAASASFMTPIGYQTNTFVYTVGGYRFKDFLKFGIWPMAIYFFGTVSMVGFLWNFFP